MFLLKAEELTLTVGQAFDLAYRRFLERKAVNQNSNKKLTEMEEKIKTAEEEKEALKQKIAELEIAAKQGPPSSNGSNEVNSKLSISHFSFIICTLSSSEVMRIKTLISARMNIILMHHQFSKLFVCTVENTFF